MKKKLSMLLVLAMLATLLTACGDSSQSASTAPSREEATVQETVVSAEETPEEAPAAVEEAVTEVPSDLEAAPEEEPLGDPMDAMKEEFISYPLEGDNSISIWYYAPGYVQYVDTNYNFNALAAAEAATGVTLEFTEVSQNAASEQFNLLVASGDYPDLIPCMEYYSSGLTKAYEEDVIVDIEPYVEEYMPNFAAVRDLLSANTQSQLETDGAMLAFYQVDDGSYSGDGLVTRGDWMEALGISFDSKLISLDQFDDMIHQFHDTYNVAHTLYFTDGTLSLNAVFDTSIPTLVGDGFMTSVSSAIFRRGDEVVSGWVQDGYREYLEYVLKLMDDGIIDRDFMGLDNDRGTQNTLCGNGGIAIWGANADKLEEIYGYTEDPDFKVAALPTVTADPDAPYVWTQEQSLVSTRSGFSMSTNCETPELVCQWENYWWTYEGYLLNNYGEEGQSLSWDGDQPKFDWETPVTVTGLNAPNAEMALELFTMKRFTGGYLDNDRLLPTFSDTALAAVDLWTIDGASDERYYPDSIVFTVAENEAVGTVESDFLTFAPTEILKFLSGAEELNDETWDAYLEKCENMGINDIIAVYQDAYDQYLAGER
jgi:putative aldouronate transport system substrate-binding protein